MCKIKSGMDSAKITALFMTLTGSLPPKFFDKEELKSIGKISDVDWRKTSYKQISLTEFDDEFSLKDRKEGSHSKWNKRVVKNNPKADERWFRKVKPDVPDYLLRMLNTIEGAHRTKFACLAPNSSIKPHVDFDTTYSIRLHIAIDTNDKCVIGGWGQRRAIVHSSHSGGRFCVVFKSRGSSFCGKQRRSAKSAFDFQC